MVNPMPMKHVDKGWGWERWIVNKEEYCGKLLYFNAGKKCSWHHHKIKDEVFYLQSGKMTVYYSDNDDLEKAEQKILNPGDNFHPHILELSHPRKIGKIVLEIPQ
jgi:mannose-6-phosphate isomerase-like protein (cupin superfamily)